MTATRWMMAALGGLMGTGLSLAVAAPLPTAAWEPAPTVQRVQYYGYPAYEAEYYEPRTTYRRTYRVYREQPFHDGYGYEYDYDYGYGRPSYGYGSYYDPRRARIEREKERIRAQRQIEKETIREQRRVQKEIYKEQLRAWNRANGY